MTFQVKLIFRIGSLNLLSMEPSFLIVKVEISRPDIESCCEHLTHDVNDTYLSVSVY